MGELVKCPVCLGNCRVFVAIDRSNGIGDIGWRPCYECGGSGTVTEERANAIRKGRELRQARVNRGETLREAATKMGITTIELSRIEQGK